MKYIVLLVLACAPAYAVNLRPYSMSNSSGDSRYVNITGDTITGETIVSTLTINQNAYIGNGILVSTFSAITGNAIIAGKIGIMKDPFYSLDTIGGAKIGTQLIVGGTFTVTGSAFSVGGSTLVVMGGNVGIGTTAAATLLDANGSAQFGNGVTKSTFTAGGIFQPISKTKAELNALVGVIGGIIACSDCTVNYSICVGAGTTTGAWTLLNAAGHCE
jgi:hypothetical protein